MEKIFNSKTKVKFRSWHFAYLPLVIFLLAFALFPFIYCLNLGFHSWNMAKPQLGYKFVGVENYLHSLQDPLFISALQNTLKFGMVVIPMELFLGLGIGVLLNREFRGKGVVRSLLLLPMMTTPIVISLIWVYMYHAEVGIINYLLGFLGISKRSYLGQRSTALWAVGVVDIWQWTPFVMLILMAGLAGIPETLYEAANVDGASNWETFKHITLPLLKVPLSIVLLFRIVDVIRLFDKIYVLTRGGPGNSTEVISFYIYRNAFMFFEMGYASAISIILLIISIIVATFYLRLLKI